MAEQKENGCGKLIEIEWRGKHLVKCGTYDALCSECQSKNHTQTKPKGEVVKEFQTDRKVSRRNGSNNLNISAKNLDKTEDNLLDELGMLDNNSNSPEVSLKFYEKEIKEIEKKFEELKKKYPKGFYLPSNDNERFNIIEAKLQTLKQCQKKHDEFVEKLKGLDMGVFVSIEGIFLDGMFNEELDKLAGRELSW